MLVCLIPSFRFVRPAAYAVLQVLLQIFYLLPDFRPAVLRRTFPAARYISDSLLPTSAFHAE